MRMKNKKWSIPFINEHDDVVIDINNVQDEKYADFFKNDELYLEIGTGKGNFILQMAQKFPKMKFLGVEKSVTCLAITAKKIVEAKLDNVRLVACDIAQLVDSLPTHKFAAIFLNFSDPWPKKRHYKRRLTYSSFLKKYATLLNEDGKIIMKTDSVPLFDFSIEELLNNGYQVTYSTYDYDGSDEFDTMTEYEVYFRNELVKINRLIAIKKEN